jgi:hypothetical protein
MSLEEQIKGLQIFFKHYKERNKEENMNMRKKTSDILSKMFGRKNVKSSLILNPISIFFI